MSDVHSILYRGPNPLEESFKPRYDPDKQPSRHWPGKVPEYVEGSADEDEGDYLEHSEEEPKQEGGWQKVFNDTAGTTHVNNELQDRRLRLIEQSGGVEEGGGALAEKLRRRKALRAAAAEQSSEGGRQKTLDTVDDTTATKQDSLSGGKRRRVVAESKVLEASDADTSAKREEVAEQAGDRSEDIAARRARLKAQALAKRRREEEDELKAAAQDDREEEESDDERFYLSDDSNSEDEDAATRHILRKPVFVPKEKRETIKERELQEEEELRKVEEKQRHLEERKKDTQAMVVQKLLKEAEEEELQKLAENGDENLAEVMTVDDADDVNEAEEYEMWKIRELKRIKRDREEREARLKFLADIARRRNMTEDERKEDDRRLDAENPTLEKGSKYRFMQKYYHSGAFFQDQKFTGDQPLYARDFNLPVGEDKLDKKVLPNAMQKRRGQFGRAGQTKYTHLADQDTTDYTAPWAQGDKPGGQQPSTKGFSNKAGGTGQSGSEFTRPTQKRAL